RAVDARGVAAADRGRLAIFGCGRRRDAKRPQAAAPYSACVRGLPTLDHSPRAGSVLKASVRGVETYESFTLKLTTTVRMNGVGTPFKTRGEYFHCFTESMAAWSRNLTPRSMRTDSTAPSTPTVASKITIPPTFATTAISG